MADRKAYGVKPAPDFACRVRYQHIPPPLPSHPVRFQLPRTIDGCDQYARGAGLVQKHPLPLLIDSHLGMAVDISSLPDALVGEDNEVNPSTYQQIDPDDEPLFAPPRDAIDKPSPTGLKKKEPKFWLRRTQYISSEIINQHKPAERTAKATEITERTREEQIRAIEKSFDSVNDAEKLKKLKHPTKADVHVEEIIPLFPDLKEMDMALTHCSFNTDPFEGAEERLRMIIQGKEERLENALMVPVVVNEEKFLMHYLPSAETAELINRKRKAESDADYFDKLHTYMWIRDYIYDSHRDDKKTGHLSFVFRDDDLEDKFRMESDSDKMAYFKVIQGRLLLKPRRPTQGNKYPEQYGKASRLQAKFKKSDVNVQENDL
ncbi:661_t:CDS:2 [Paraglomus occultum]|uniref:661_t:CDS:1 n=1 Tax=Paraglomus occultum TaxID=144539 RepID=A0A9N8VUJ5_9GLOM|nr:661_t:CDS:2 [Paraglomus occultum]